MTQPASPSRIAIAVQGRFHAFPLAAGLVAAGHDVTLFTNYPKGAAERSGAPAGCVRANHSHGVVARLQNRFLPRTGEPFVHRWFGRWAADQLARQEWDFTHVWSSVASEWLATPQGSRNTLLARGSAHIRVQRELLDEEASRTGVPLERPSDWMVAREESEYARAPLVIVPSRFAVSTFLSQGFDPSRIRLIPLAMLATPFKAEATRIAQRVERLRARRPLRLLVVGTVSYQKGMYDLERIAAALPPNQFEFRLVGPILRECQDIVRRMAGRVDIRGRKPESGLPEEYAWADLMLLPTIQDGFALVLSQALAAGVPFIASSHSGGPDLVQAGAPGWILPPRSPEAWVDRILELDQSRDPLIEAVIETTKVDLVRTWTDVAHDLVEAAGLRNER